MAGAAGAQEPTVVDQYTEQVPTPGGEKPVDEMPSDTNSGGSRGSTAAVPVAPTGGSNGGSGGGDATGNETESGGGKGEADDAVPAAKGSMAAPDRTSDDTALSPEPDSNGMGLLFPLILVGCLIAVAVIFFARRHSGSGSRAA